MISTVLKRLKKISTDIDFAFNKALVFATHGNFLFLIYGFSLTYVIQNFKTLLLNFKKL